LFLAPLFNHHPFLDNKYKGLRFLLVQSSDCSQSQRNGNHHVPEGWRAVELSGMAGVLNLVEAVGGDSASRNMRHNRLAEGNSN
jgi:hypothetical protein